MTVGRASRGDRTDRPGHFRALDHVGLRGRRPRPLDRLLRGAPGRAAAHAQDLGRALRRATSWATPTWSWRAPSSACPTASCSSCSSTRRPTRARHRGHGVLQRGQRPPVPGDRRHGGRLRAPARGRLRQRSARPSPVRHPVGAVQGRSRPATCATPTGSPSSCWRSRRAARTGAPEGPECRR